MLGKKKAVPEPLGRRRPVQTPENRAQSLSYYSQSRNATPRSDSGHTTARREALPRPKSEMLRYVGQRFGFFIAIIATAGLLISSVQVSMNPRLEIINNTEVYRIHNDSVYVAALQKELQSSWTNTNKITINTAKVAADLKKQYPELADVSLTLPVLGQRPIAYLQLTRPSLLLVSTGGAAFVLDENGRVLAPAAQVDNLDAFKLPTITDQSGLQVPVGKVVLSASTVSFIRSVAYQLSAAHVAYGTLTLPAATQELDVSLPGKPYIIRYNTHEDNAREQTGDYLAVQATLQKQGIQPKSYIDVRLAGRTYYK